MKRSKLLLISAALTFSGAAHAQDASAETKPTIILVHGAFADDAMNVAASPKRN